MRTVQSPTRWAGSILAACVTIALIALTSLPARAQDSAADVAAAEAAASADAAEAAEAEAAAAEAEAEAAAAAEQAEIDAALAEDAPHCTGTGVEGVVRDAQTRETMIEAPVIVVGRGRRTLTDYDGRFAIDLPPGTYSLRSYYDLYQPTRIDDVVVRRGECTRVELDLAIESTTGEEVVIEVRAEAGTAASQLRVRRESAAVQDAISSEEMRRAPDSTASEAARRIVGVTMLNDYLYVRGLGGRYVTVLMNGVALPQTDPDVPGVQLDILPSALLESLSISKTFTAQLPGDWAGGLVDVGTASFPTDFELRAGVSFGVNTETSFQTLLGSQSGSLDWLGWDDGTRSFPAGVQGVDVDSLPRAEQDALSAQFANTWAMRTRTGLPNMGLSLSIGDTVDVGGHLLGYRLLASYRIGERTVADFVQTLVAPEAGEPVRPRETLTQTGSERYSQLGALGTLTFELERGHQLTLNLLFSQNAEDMTARQVGMSETLGADIDAYRMSWLQRTLFFSQLLGEHRDLFGSARFDWQLNASIGDRAQPDLRDMTYVRQEDGRYRYIANPLAGNRFTSNLGDASFGGGAGLTIPIDQLTLRVGGLYRRTERDLRIRRFGWNTDGRAPPEGPYLSPSQLFAPENINTYLRLIDRTQPRDGYDASQELLAAYVSAEWAPWSFLRLVAGVRAESFRQIVTTVDPTGVDAPQVGVTRTDVDPLPSAAAIVEVTDDVFVRASYGGTVGRPLIRELADFPFIDFVRRRTVTGDPDLQRTYIHNFDLRLEWFPSESEVLAISAFAKVFERPIEQVIVDVSGNASFANVQGAENYGVEAEARVHLGHIAPELSWITLGANVAAVYSRARLSAAEQDQATNAERPLAGQAPFVINAGIGLAPPGTNLTINVLYNVLGPRLEDVGLRPYDDVYRQPLQSLDVTASWQFAPGFSLRFSGQNVLFQRQELTQGEHVVLGFTEGTRFTLGLGVSN